MKIRTVILFAGMVGAIAGPALAQTSTDDSSTQMQSTQNPNNPQKPYVDTPGINKGTNESERGDATGSIGGNANTGGDTTGGTGGAGNGGNTGAGGTGGSNQ
jgi:hypothetical protein